MSYAKEYNEMPKASNFCTLGDIIDSEVAKKLISMKDRKLALKKKREDKKKRRKLAMTNKPVSSETERSRY